jgi:hypothetical protein
VEEDSEEHKGIEEHRPRYEHSLCCRCKTEDGSSARCYALTNRGTSQSKRATRVMGCTTRRPTYI